MVMECAITDWVLQEWDYYSIKNIKKIKAQCMWVHPMCMSKSTSESFQCCYVNYKESQQLNGCVQKVGIGGTKLCQEWRQTSGKPTSGKCHNYVQNGTKQSKLQNTCQCINATALCSHSWCLYFQLQNFKNNIPDVVWQAQGQFETTGHSFP